MTIRINCCSSLLLILYCMVFQNCTTSKQSRKGDSHTSRSSVDWEGTYKGILPCAGCEGILTLVQLNKDNTYELQRQYLGKDPATESTAGIFSWKDNDGKLVFKNGKKVWYLQLGENRLFWLDEEGKRIPGDRAEQYMLAKQENIITERYWKLSAVAAGTPVAVTGNREAYFILKQDGGRFTGHGGCNGINGTYELKGASGLAFANIASTEMACGAMDTERKLLVALQQTSRYSLVDDTLCLQDERKNILAKFELVYLR